MLHARAVTGGVSGKVTAIRRSLAVVEFDLDGIILDLSGRPAKMIGYAYDITEQVQLE